MNEFEFHKPSSLDEAVTLLQSDEDAKFLGGGQSLIPTMKQGFAMPTKLVALSHLPELKGIRTEGDTLIIGGGATHADVERSADVAAAIPSLAALAAQIGDPQVRHRGTLGGSVAHADPAADYPAALVALNATIETHTRKIPVDGFFTGLFETALEPTEIVTAVHFPVPKKAAYAKFPNPASLYAIAGVFVAQLADGSVRVAVTGASTRVFRVTEMESALAGDFSPGAIEGIAVPTDDLTSEPDASAEYRAHLVGVMARRAVAAANG